MKNDHDIMSTPTGDAPPLAQRILAGVRGMASRVRPSAIERTTATPPSANGATPSRGANGASGTQRPGVGRGMSRLLIGMLAYVVGSYALQIVLVLIDATFKLHLNTVQTLLPQNTPIIGGMTKFALIYFLLVILLIWALFRFNVIPRDPFGARAEAEARRRRNSPAAPQQQQTSWSSRRRAARRAAQAEAANQPTIAGKHDEEYQRVRALQRARRRK